MGFGSNFGSFLAKSVSIAGLATAYTATVPYLKDLAEKIETSPIVTHNLDSLTWYGNFVDKTTKAYLEGMVLAAPAVLGTWAFMKYISPKIDESFNKAPAMQQ